MMQAQQYLCVFTDVHMPIMSGFDQVLLYLHITLHHITSPQTL
jgi:FixJ family two-component response regulator